MCRLCDLSGKYVIYSRLLQLFVKEIECYYHTQVKKLGIR